jgi:hypothetical protein
MADLGGRAERTVDLFRRRCGDMSRRTLCDANIDIEAIACDEPARGGQEDGEQRVSRGRRRKQHAQRVALIEVGEPGDTLAIAEIDFGDAVR